MEFAAFASAKKRKDVAYVRNEIPEPWMLTGGEDTVAILNEWRKGTLMQGMLLADAHGGGFAARCGQDVVRKARNFCVDNWGLLETKFASKYAFYGVNDVLQSMALTIEDELVRDYGQTDVGVVFAGVLFIKGHAVAFNVGDCSVFRVLDNKLTVLSHDHGPDNLDEFRAVCKELKRKHKPIPTVSYSRLNYPDQAQLADANGNFEPISLYRWEDDEPVVDERNVEHMNNFFPGGIQAVHRELQPDADGKMRPKPGTGHRNFAASVNGVSQVLYSFLKRDCKARNEVMLKMGVTITEHKNGATYLVCSDGFTDALHPTDIEHAMTASRKISIEDRVSDLEQLSLYNALVENSEQERMPLIVQDGEWVASWDDLSCGVAQPRAN